MTISIHRTEDYAQINLVGDIDMARLEEHADELEDVGADLPRRVVFNLEQVTFMDSSGFGVIARYIRESPHIDGTVYVVAAPDAVARSMTVLGLNRHVTFADSLDDPILPS